MRLFTKPLPLINSQKGLENPPDLPYKCPLFPGSQAVCVLPCLPHLPPFFLFAPLEAPACSILQGIQPQPAYKPLSSGRSDPVAAPLAVAGGGVTIIRQPLYVKLFTKAPTCVIPGKPHFPWEVGSAVTCPSADS